MSSEKIKNSFWFRHFLMCHHLANKNIKLGKVLNFANCILQEEQGKVANSQMTYHFWAADSFLCELHCSDEGTVFDNLEEEELTIEELADLSSMELYEYYNSYCVGTINFNPID